MFANVYIIHDYLFEEMSGVNLQTVLHDPNTIITFDFSKTFKVGMLIRNIKHVG